MNIYTEHHIQFSKIAMYQLQKAFVLPCVVGINALSILVYFLGLGAILSLSLFFGLTVMLLLKLWVKHPLFCPQCNKDFYGPFKVLMPYTPHCVHCGISFIADGPTKLHISKI
jgi:hypothetical protein